MTSLNVVLYQPEIPQNTGNIARTCVAVDAKLWLVRPFGFRLDDHHLRRAGLDYWQHLDYEVVDNWQRFREQLVGRQSWYFSKTASTSYTAVQYAQGDYLVFGPETKGLPIELINDNRQQALRIPISDKVRSLNLSNAVAVAVYEVIRQLFSS